MAEQNYFEDVQEGQALPEIKIAPDKQQLVKFAAGSGDFNPLHFDENFPMLKPMGLSENIVHGRFKYAQVGRVVFAFAGYKGRVNKFGVNYRGMDMLNKPIIAGGVGGEAIIKSAVDTFGRIDVLVNNAGILRDRMIFNMTEEEWDAVIAVHLKGHYCCTKPASILMRQQRSGRIINFSSGSGLIG